MSTPSQKLWSSLSEVDHYLALPVRVNPLLILLPSAVLLGLAMNLAAGSFKKYL